MSKKYLGERFDIHCGGVDHIPVHHTNEIAQTEAATGVSPWVNVWMHAEFLLMNKEKMSKSSGSFATLKALEDQGYHALDYRFFCLQAQYRTQLSFSPEAMDAAKAGRRNLVERVAQLLRSVAGAREAASMEPLGTDDPILGDFVAAVADDLNMPRAMAALNAVVKDTGLDGLRRLRAIEAMDRVLGLDLVALARDHLAREDQSPLAQAEDPEAARIQSLVDERTRARQSKDWARSDQIRAELTALGVTVLDSPQGSTWKRS
jgi:cysteinyl-tRNA synthetase